jgi:hypothetical protein
MAFLPQPHLLSWHQIDAASDLDRLRLVLSAMPDEKLVRLLEAKRGKGRDDYPIRPVWNALIAGIVYQHPSAASLLRELRRNAELRQVCGFNPHRGGFAVPTDDAFGNFLALIIQHRDELTGVFHALVFELQKLLPNLGVSMAVDSKAIQSAGKPVKDEDKQQERDARRDLDADWGCKTYKGKRADGSSWEKVIKWFGYKLHLLVDATYELPLAFSLTKASSGDSPELLPLVEQLQEQQPALYERDDKRLAADKAYDSNENNRALYEDHDIIPVIDKRTLWKGETTKALNAQRADSFIYNEDGEVFCVEPKTGEQRALFFMGFEADRKTLKYRCPAAACDFECQGRPSCERGRNIGEFGRVVRVPLCKDYRIFTPIARHTDKFDKAYDKRTSVERVNSRLDRVLGFEEHFIRGMDKMQTRVTLALIVMLAMALGRIRANQADLMRSLTAPVRRAA